MASDLGTLQVQFPHDRRNLRPWHQDYPYVRDSEDAVIYWIPLRSLEGQNCSLQVARDRTGWASCRCAAIDCAGRAASGPCGSPTCRAWTDSRSSPCRRRWGTCWCSAPCLLLHASAPEPQRTYPLDLPGPPRQFRGSPSVSELARTRPAPARALPGATPILTWNPPTTRRPPRQEIEKEPFAAPSAVTPGGTSRLAKIDRTVRHLGRFAPWRYQTHAPLFRS